MTVRQPSLSARSPRLCPNSAQAQRPLRLSVILSLPPLCFHGLTNPFSRNPFTFTSIQNPRGCGVTAVPANSVSACLSSNSTLNPFPATHPKNARLTPFAATHTKSPSCKSFPCHTSEKAGGGITVNHSHNTHIWNPVQLSGVQDTVRKSRPQLVRSQQGRADARSAGSVQILWLRSRRPKCNLHTRAWAGARLLGP